MRACQFAMIAALAVCALNVEALDPASYDNPTNAFRAITHNDYGHPGAWQRKRHAAKLEEIKKVGGAPVVLIGDSITHYWEERFGDDFKAKFGSGARRALNLGMCVDGTEHVLWRLDEGGELDGYEAKAVFLMIGTNNTGLHPFDSETPAQTIIGIRKIIDVIRAKQPNAKVILTAIFPRGEDANDGRRKRNDVVNREIRKFCDGKDIVWLDVAPKLLEKDGTLSREICSDLVHPTQAGYDIWYAAMKPYLDWALEGADLPPDCGPGEEKESDDPAAAAVEPTTHIKRYNFWVKRLERNLRLVNAYGGDVDLVFAGDSITHNWDGRGRRELNALMEKYSLLNLGYSGDTTGNLLWRIRNGEMTGYKAKCIMLTLGINNSAEATAEDVAHGIKAILDEIAVRQPQAKVLLLPVFPSKSPGDSLRDRGDKVNKIIKGYADGKKVIWIDFTAGFLDEKGGTWKNMPDGVHPAPAAYGEIWLPAVQPYFEKIIAEQNAKQ